MEIHQFNLSKLWLCQPSWKRSLIKNKILCDVDILMHLGTSYPSEIFHWLIDKLRLNIIFFFVMGKEIKIFLSILFFPYSIILQLYCTMVVKYFFFPVIQNFFFPVIKAKVTKNMKLKNSFDLKISSHFISSIKAKWLKVWKQRPRCIFLSTILLKNLQKWKPKRNNVESQMNKEVFSTNGNNEFLLTLSNKIFTCTCDSK